jgi:hypothetical protein
MKPQPLIAVHDVEASSAWYETILGLQSGDGGHQDVHEHPHSSEPGRE